MEQLIVTLIVGLLATPVATMVVYLTTRKKTHAESQAAIAAGATNAVEAISAVLDSLKQELEETKQELSSAISEIEKLREINEELVRENIELRHRIDKLTALIEKNNPDI